eukprot:832826-Rhodomonas_salina.1
MCCTPTAPRSCTPIAPICCAHSTHWVDRPSAFGPRRCPAYGHDGSLSRVKGISAEKQSSGRKVVVEATMAEAIADKIHAAEEVAKKMNNVGKGREAK